MPKPFEPVSGTYTGDGNAKTLTLGFTPLIFRLVNITDRIVHEKFDTMTTTQSLARAAAGTGTEEAHITFTDGTVVIAAAANVNAKVYHYVAISAG